MSIFVTYLLRNRAGQWTVVMQERITPLVWLFGVLIIFSVPFVSYHKWFKKSDDKVVRGTTVADVNRPNIILVTFDALTAREMSAYGYHRETTPFIRRWSENATVFSKVEASSNFTTPSVASLMTGKRVWTHQTYHIEGTKPVRNDVESLPSVLKDYGYLNIALVVNPFASVKVLGMADSFDIAPPATEFSMAASLFGWKFGIIDAMLFRVFSEKIRLHNWILKNDFIFGKFINLISRNVNQTEVPPEKAFNKLLEIMDNNIQEPFFAWIHVFPPHDPYLPPEPFKGKFNPSSDMRSYKSQEKLVQESYKYLFQYRSFSKEMQPSVNMARDYYDEFIAYIDKKYEDFILELEKRRIKNTVVILSADHGDSFEHGYFTHGGPFLYEHVTHVPLIIKEPAQNTGQVVSGIVEQIDIPATILDLAVIPVPSWMEGRSLVPLMRGEELQSKPAFSMNFEENPSRGRQINRGSIAVWEGDYKLIHYLANNESLLFNLKQDYNEMNNIFYEETEISQHLLALIQSNLEKANERIRDARK
ncbi:MAG: sulfatase [Nitrospirae bacterium]|nr:sulfatase [Nitrospirota bacterium]